MRVSEIADLDNTWRARFLVSNSAVVVDLVGVVFVVGVGAELSKRK